MIPDAELKALRVLNDHGVEYLVAGGTAVHHYCPQRPARDVDVYVSTEVANAKRVHAAVLSILGYEPKIDWTVWLQDRKCVQFRSWSHLEMEIFTTLPGVSFADAYRARETVLQGGAAVPIISRHDLILVKCAIAASDPKRRDRELADLALLRAVAP